MNTKFRINVMTDACLLKVHDESMYAPEICLVEFVAYVKDGVSTLSAKSKRILKSQELCDYRYELERDGRYTYYKVLLPYYSLFDHHGMHIHVPYGYFVAEDAKGNKIICLNDKNSVSLVNTSESIEVKEIDDYMELINSGLVAKHDYFSQDFFSICKLDACLAKLQKKYILNHVDDCGSSKCSKGSDSDRANRDFLFITSYVLDYLISNEEFDQAEEILDKIHTCSNSLCEDSNINKNCNCNG